MEAKILFYLVIAIVVGFIIWKQYTKKKDYELKVKLFEEFENKKKIWRKHFGSIGSSDISDKALEFMKTTDLSTEDKETIINGIVAEAVENMLEDNYLSSEEENQLNHFMSQFPKSIWNKDIINKLNKARIIKALINDEPLPITPSLNTTLLLSKNEECIYVFNSIRFAQERTNTTFVGGSRGISVRVAKGVYLRGGGFSGHSVKTSEIQMIDTGELVITTQNIYFRGANKSFKIELKKVMNLEAFSNGIKVEKEGVSFKPFYFLDVDVWLSGNLISILTGRLR